MRGHLSMRASKGEYLLPAGGEKEEPPPAPHPLLPARGEKVPAGG
jgi:hypothetical protein